MEVYRDAVVLTWKAECFPGSPAVVARSLTNEVQPMVVYTDPGGVELLHTASVEATWTTARAQNGAGNWKKSKPICVWIGR